MAALMWAIRDGLVSGSHMSNIHDRAAHACTDTVHAASGFGPCVLHVCSSVSVSRCGISLTTGAGSMSPSQLVWTDISNCLMCHNRTDMKSVG